MVLLSDVSKAEAAVQAAERTLKAFKKAFDLKDRKIHITTSIGIAIHPEDGNDVEMLTRNADIAMYAAKEESRNTFKLFSQVTPDSAPRGRAE